MLLKITILLCGITCVLGAAIPEGNGTLSNERIVGGYQTTIVSFPWQVSIQSDDGHFCGGCIYSDIIIITAAHCLEWIKTTSSLMIRAGSDNWHSGGSLHPVAYFTIHPYRDPSTNSADVAIMRLSTALPLGVTMQPIPLATSPPAHDDGAKVSGWGTLTPGVNNIPDQLRAANIKIVSWAKCRSADYGYGSEILAGMICAAGIGKDSCQGDSGGPLVSGGVLVGIVSWGYSCALPYYPGVYASVAFYHDWLVNTALAMS